MKQILRSYSFLAKTGIDAFFFLLILMVAVAWLWPTPGNWKGLFSLGTLADLGVAGIFFFYGLRLNPKKIKSGVSNWQLHLLVQLVTFVLCPLIAITFRYAYAGQGHDNLWLGIIFLSVLPGTVSSAIVMISIAGGNITGGIFNATLASMLGIVITPLWMSFFMEPSKGGGGFMHIFLTLVMQILVPVCIGFLLHQRGGHFAERHHHSLRLFEKSVILLIVYNAFCESFAAHMFQGMSLLFLVELCIVLLLAFLILCSIVYAACKILRFNRPDTITAIFCGSKKSLVHGTVMGNVIFSQAGAMGILLLPIMLYHALQLIAASVMAQLMARQH